MVYIEQTKDGFVIKTDGCITLKGDITLKGVINDQ